MSCAGQSAARPSDGRTIEEKLCDMAEDQKVLVRYYATLCTHHNENVDTRGSMASDGTYEKVPDELSVRRSTGRGSKGKYCWYDGFVNTATKLYFHPSSTVTFGDDGVVFWCVKTQGPVYKAYDIPIDHSYKTIHGWCVAVKSRSHTWTHTVKVFADDPLWRLDVPCKHTIVESPADGFTMHEPPMDYFAVGKSFGQHREHGHRDMYHHFVHMVDFYVPVCGQDDTPERAVERFARAHARTWMKEFNIRTFPLPL